MSVSLGLVIHAGKGRPSPGAGGNVLATPGGIPHAWQAVNDVPGQKLILTVAGGIEDFFDDLVADISSDDLAHPHGVQFLD